MQTANSRLCPDLAPKIAAQIGRPRAGRLLLQSEMGSVVVVITDILEAEAHQMSLVQRDHVIQHVPAYAAHPSFRDSILPGTANACPNSFDSAGLQKCTHLGTEFPVTIKDNVAIRAWKRQRLSKLLHNPLARRICGHVDVENAAPMMLDDKEAIQYAETQRWYGEEVEGRDQLTVVLEKCQPTLHLHL